MTDDRGMVPREKWAQSDVHKASRYACGKCGTQFASPHEFYAHLDAEHPKKRAPKAAREAVGRVFAEILRERHPGTSWAVTDE